MAGALIALWWAGRFWTVIKAAASSFFVLGKLIIVGGAAPGAFGMPAWELAIMVFYMDVTYAYLLAFNLDYVHRLPRAGPWLERLQDYCHYWLAQQPWMRRFAFTGVMLFVMFPLTGTGAPGGSILGRLVGLGPVVTMIAIAVGSALGCGLMAAFAARLEPFFHEIQDEIWFKASGLVILAIVVIVLFFLGRKLSRAAREFARSQASGGDA